MKIKYLPKTTEPMIKRYLRYQRHVVTYIDIMGFRQLVVKESPNIISRAIRQVQQITAPTTQTTKHFGENYVNFSDLIVHTTSLDRRTQNGLEDILREIKHIALVQAVLIEKWLLLRGAITVGEMERSYGVLFGPGLISAYELERDHAQFPRIIVDDRLLTLIKSKGSLKELSDCTRRDDDGLVFIDYLGLMQRSLNNDLKSFHRLVETHKALIERNLTKFGSDKRVLSKYLWLRKYHNATVRAVITEGQQKRLYIAGPTTASSVPLLTPDLED
jgi:hypothetical protein